MCTRAQCCWFWFCGFVCAITVSGQVAKHTRMAYTFFYGVGHMWCCQVGEHKHVCSKACDAHDVAAAARFLVLGLLLLLLLLLLLQFGLGCKPLLSRGPGSPEVLPCSTWAICGVVGERTHVCAQGHSVAGCAWAVFVVLLLFLGR